ncbi:MAG: PEGA domain-containing protein [Candidatus Electryonea clarkiae]|nr:PEGA domain-containing protein [Candidatus Electryonea clarkiae]
MLTKSLSFLLLISTYSLCITGEIHADNEVIPAYKVAVLTFLVHGREELSAESLTQIVRAEFQKNERILLIDQKGIKTSPVETGSDKSVRVFDLESLVKAGKTLEVEKIVGGTINQIGTKYMIELRAVNVRSESIEAIETADYSGNIKHIDKPLKMAAERLAAQIVNRSGVIIVDTNPDESSVKINGITVGLAPVRIKKPGGVKYRIKAERMGYEAVERKVYLAEGDSLGLKLSLPKLSKRLGKPPLARIWLSGGIPMNQNSSSIDTRITWGKGTSYGVAADFGDIWRLRFGTYSYSGKIRDVNETYLEDFNADGDPRGHASVYYSTLIYTMSPVRTGAVLGGGIAALTREVSINLNDANETSRQTDLELGLLLELGVEFRLFRDILSQIEFIHVRIISQKPGGEQDETIHPAWNESFRAFESFTVLKFSVGYRF